MTINGPDSTVGRASKVGSSRLRINPRSDNMHVPETLPSIMKTRLVPPTVRGTCNPSSSRTFFNEVSTVHCENLYVHGTLWKPDRFHYLSMIILNLEWPPTDSDDSRQVEVVHKIAVYQIQVWQTWRINTGPIRQPYWSGVLWTIQYTHISSWTLCTLQYSSGFYSCLNMIKVWLWCSVCL